MSIMNISLPEELKAFVDRRIATEGYESSSDYLSELIRRDRDRVAFRDHLLEAAATEPAGPMDEAYFQSLRTCLDTGDKPPA